MMGICIVIWGIDKDSSVSIILASKLKGSLGKALLGCVIERSKLDGMD